MLQSVTSMPEQFRDVEHLEQVMSSPDPQVVAEFGKLDGDLAGAIILHDVGEMRRQLDDLRVFEPGTKDVRDLVKRHSACAASPWAMACPDERASANRTSRKEFDAVPAFLRPDPRSRARDYKQARVVYHAG